MREFGRGVGMLAAGIGWWRRRPALMALGLLPALIVGVVMLAALVVLIGFLPQLTALVTPFADQWAAVWVVLLRVLVGIAMVVAALVLAAVTFTALSLIVGEPAYDRIWREVESDAGGAVPSRGPGFWRGALDGLRLVVRGIGVALLVLLVGFVPIVGPVAGAVLGTLLGASLLADELASRALSARGIGDRERRALLRGRRDRRGRALGFGVVTQLCFLVPLGAVLVMPSAVVGATLLARSLLDDADADAGTGSAG